MLHIILGILRVIGILLMVVLGLVLLIALSVLLVPVRYELSGKKKAGAMAVRAQVSWMGPLIGAVIGYRDGRMVMRLKLLGITVKKAGAGGKMPTPGKKNRKAEKKSEKDTGLAEGSWQTETEKTDPDRQVLGQKENSDFSGELYQGIDDRQDTDETVGGLRTSGQKLPTDAKEGVSGKRRAGLNRLFEKAAAVSGRIVRACVRLIGKIWDFVIWLPERMLDLAEWFQNLASDRETAMERMAGRIKQIKTQTEIFLEPASIELYKKIRHQIKRLLHHYGPRHIRGWLRFGTGSPDQTGMVTGLLYMILPARADEFELQPEFTEMVLETDIAMKGRIRVCHILWTAAVLWRDRQLRTLIRRVKGGS